MTNGSRVMAFRPLRALRLGVLTALLVTGPASAKSIPFFTVEINPPQPVAGEAIVVTVRTWEDVAHSVPARLDRATRLDGLLVLRSVSGDSPDVAIQLEYQAQDEFRASVVVPTAGNWKVVAFPDRTGWATPDVPPGYPDSIALTVRAQNGSVPTLAAVAGVALIVIVGFLGIVARRRSRRPSMRPLLG